LLAKITCSEPVKLGVQEKAAVTSYDGEHRFSVVDDGEQHGATRLKKSGRIADELLIQVWLRRSIVGLRVDLLCIPWRTLIRPIGGGGSR
jgi:hypothetical protein